MRGKDTTEAAIAEATQVKTISVPNKNLDTCPIDDSLPIKMRRKYPVTTGGNAKGKEIKDSKINLPLISFLPISHPTYIATGILIEVATTATFRDNKTKSNNIHSPESI
tara:strand:+ start:2082 stop:2408 length:327 start_codon:yes stop_codon:yes gene_type:complete